MTWLDARIKFIGDSLVVELRSLPTQPTQEEELLLTLLYIGRLADAQARRERLLPIERVRTNRHRAMMFGVSRSLWFMSDYGTPEELPCSVGLSREIERACSGLQELGLLHLLDELPLSPRDLLANRPPSERLARILGEVDSIEPVAMQDALRATKMLV